MSEQVARLNEAVWQELGGDPRKIGEHDLDTAIEVLTAITDTLRAERQSRRWRAGKPFKGPDPRGGGKEKKKGKGGR